MNKPEYFIGIDVSSETLDVAIYRESKPAIASKEPFTNDIDGFNKICSWLSNNGASKDNAVICLETTGVYSENICYYLYDKGFVVWSEAPHKVHRAFHHLIKNDKVSAIQIGEYAFRFFDQISVFEPNEVIIEQIQTLLTTREQLVIQKTASKNIIKTINRKHYKTPLADNILNATIEHLETSIEEIEKALRNLIKSNPRIGAKAEKIASIPGISMLFTANFIVATDGLTKHMEYRKLASYVGVCPNEYKSGTSVYRKPRSSGHGPSRLRKLLYLAAMSVRTHNAKFHDYFVLKQAQGKNSKLILNNIVNKLLKLVCAISKNDLSFEKDYRSVHPKFLKGAI
jgi:transposase